jgi:hypothetical protein
MNHTDGYYDWRGHPVGVEWFDATDGEIDVYFLYDVAEHPTGYVPEGEVHALVTFCYGGGGGFWVERERFLADAEPLVPEQDGIGAGETIQGP